MRGKTGTIIWFELTRTDFYDQWQGKLILGWPGLELAWYRRAHKNELPVIAILEESALAGPIPDWNLIDFGWRSMRTVLRDDPAHHRPLTPAFNIGSESVRE
jgi:hypothetical protein